MDKAWVWVWPPEPFGVYWPTCGSFYSLAAAVYKRGSAACSQLHRSVSLKGIKLSQSCIFVCSCWFSAQAGC